MMQIVDDRLDDLVLARALLTKEGPADIAISRALRPLAPSSLDDANWARAVRESCERLRGAHLLDGARKPANAAQLVSKRLHLARATTWKPLLDRVIPGLALGVAPDDARAHKRLGDRDHLAAAIIARAQGLWVEGPPPSASAVSDAVVWRVLRLPGNAKRTPPEIRAHFLAAVLGASSGPAAPNRMLRQLAAKEVGAVRADLRALRDALGRRWLCGVTFGERPSAAQPTSLEVFAAAVRDAAARATSGLYGDRKVFVVAAWRALRGHPDLGSMSLDDFKQRLLAAHRAGLVALARADLTSAMDPEAVHESELRHLEARYHFIERGSP